MCKNLIVFMPSIEGGGVEKNLFLICNFLVKKTSSLKVITISKKYTNKFDKPIKIISLKSKQWDRFNRKIKYFQLLTWMTFMIITFAQHWLAKSNCKAEKNDRQENRNLFVT